MATCNVEHGNIPSIHIGIKWFSEINWLYSNQALSFHGFFMAYGPYNRGPNNIAKVSYKFNRFPDYLIFTEPSEPLKRSIMPSKMEVASHHCDTVPNKTKDIFTL